MIAAALAITGCGSDSSTDDKPAAEPEATPVITAEPSYDAYDCQALLERNYDDGDVHDASSEPQCGSLTRDEYTDAVKKVITGRKDEILDTAANQDNWDEAWDQTDADQQNLVCDRLHEDGATVVGKEMADSTGDDEDEQILMARYLLTEKC
ncbi:hypothetical protein C1N81_39680 [Streptomyces sp. SGAir0957]